MLTLFKSIRFQIVLWYMLILSLTLFLFSLVLYQNFSHKLKSDMDDLLRSRAQGISDSIDAYWESERIEVSDDIPSHAFTKENNLNFLKIAKRWVNDKSTDPNLIDFFVRIFDANGRPIASSKNLSVPTFSKIMFKDIVNKSSRYDNWKVELTQGKPVTLRSFTVSVIENHRLSYIVQVTSPLTSMRVALHNLSILLFFLLPVTVVLTGIAGAFLAKVALNPVHTMIKTIHQIRAENMKLRIGMPPAKDEIHELAVTFNEMIARLDEAFTSQRQFMEDISHELKTPLSILKGELEITLKKVRSTAEYEDTIESSLEEVDRIVRIVGNLLTLANFDTKTVTLEKEKFNLNQLFRSALEDIGILAQQKDINLVYHEQQEIFLTADYGHIRRVILNLLDNAIKYTPQNGTVTIDIYQEGSIVKVEIADTGIGISEEQLPFVFDRFYRAERSRSETKGFGLGLSIAKSIMEAHGGRIEVESSLNGGAIFKLFFPAVVP